MRKLSKKALEQFKKTTGVSVAYPEAKPEEVKPEAQPPQPQEVILSVPEDLLEPLMVMITKLMVSHQETQAAITELASMLSTEKDRDFSITAEVIERDRDGNISRLTFDRNQVTH